MRKEGVAGLGRGRDSICVASANYPLVEVNYLCTEGVFDYNHIDWGIGDSELGTYGSFGSYSSGYDEPNLNSGTLAATFIISRVGQFS